MNHIILIGFMGAGKTSVGKELARRQGLEFLDTDDFIEERQGRSIRDIFAQDGEACFRDMETETLRELSRETKKRLVIAVGGGLPMRKENRALLRELGAVVYLKAAVETLLKRLSGDTTRPKLQGGDLRTKIEGLMREREDIYRETARLEIGTDGKAPSEIAEEIVSFDNAAAAGKEARETAFSGGICPALQENGKTMRKTM